MRAHRTSAGENGTGKRTIILLAVFLTAVLLLAAGCSSGQGSGSESKAADGTFQIYYANREGTKLVREDYTCKGTTFDERMDELLQEFKTPRKPDLEKSALPEGVTINGTSIVVTEIDVDFNSAYLSLNTAQELLLRSALVETLIQLSGVDKVRFTVDEQPLSDAEGNEVGAMDADTFIVPEGDAINSYRNIEIPLYFSDASGDRLVKENRHVIGSSNIITERIVVEQLISGPQNDNLLPVASSSVIVPGVRIKGDTCLIDFSDAINDAPSADSPVKPETALYAFVNSIIDACEDKGVKQVAFTIDTNSDSRFRGQVNLDQEFTWNADIIDAGDEEPKEGSVLVGGDSDTQTADNIGQSEGTEG